MSHTKECLEKRAQNQKDIEDWKKKWPKYCKSCGGWGGNYYSYDPSPAGVGLSPGSMTDFITCEECLDKNICPRCHEDGVTIMPPSKDGLVVKCLNCGWDDYQEGCPHEIEDCCCDMLEFFGG